MKNTILSAAASGALLFSTLAALAQGSLTPSGAPAPTMVTLQQIQPRTPVSTAGFIISKPGSYYLTTNIFTTGTGLTILTNDVTLDLNGFAIVSTATTAVGYGILLENSTNIRIANGSISGSVVNSTTTFTGGGFNAGIYNDGGVYNAVVSGVNVSGVMDDGINLGMLNCSTVESCNAYVTGGYGISADTVANCNAQLCGNYGIYAIDVHNSKGQSVVSDGIYANNAVNCYGYAGTPAYTTGIQALSVQNCYGNSASSLDGYGIYANTVQNCTGGANFVGVSGMVVFNSYGSGIVAAGTGVFASICAMNSEGYCTSGVGLNTDFAFMSFGYSRSEVGLVAIVANSCGGSGSTNYTVTYKYNMP